MSILYTVYGIGRPSEYHGDKMVYGLDTAETLDDAKETAEDLVNEGYSVAIVLKVEDRGDVPSCANWQQIGHAVYVAKA